MESPRLTSTPSDLARRKPAIAGLAVAILLGLLAARLAAQEEPSAEEEGEGAYTRLELERRTSAMIDWESQPWAGFRVEVPSDAVVLTLEVEDAPVDLDLFARRERPITNYEEDAEYEASSRLYNDTLTISRSGEPALVPGTYYVDVAYTVETEPRIGKRRVTEIPFTLTASVIRSRVDGRLVPGEPWVGQTSADSGWFRTFTIEVPERASVLRIDLDQATGDLDLVARHGQPVLSIEDADHFADSLLGRETLVIDEASDPPLASGTWYVSVFDPFQLDLVRFTARVGFDSRPAPELLAIPTLRQPAQGIDRALLSTVELLTSAGNGSGTLVSPAGWVLTNFHVVVDDSGNPVGQGELVISLCLDPRMPPAELFRGSVVLADRQLDLALVRIESGLYGQPLPAGYQFPYLETGSSEALAIGDPVTILGFPGVGGMGSRVSVSLTRGVISGYDTTEAGVVFKTDAEIGSGNSGGAALDAAYRLIGVPTGTVEDAEGYSQLGYILPISRLPQAWKEKIEP